MKSIKDKVKFLLDTYPHLRDNDFKLIANYYFYEVGHDDINTMSALDFLEMFATGKLTHSESIRRVRQKIQEDNPHLRGKSYKRRKDDENNTKNNIKNL
jgi:hypothetical protein